MKSFTTIILKLNEANANNRIYTTEVAEEMILRATERGAVLGELTYPQGDLFSSISLDNASHTISNLRVEGNLLLGDVTLLTSPKGEVAKVILESGVHNYGFRPRGFAKVDANGVVHDYQLVSIDLVNDPA